MNLQQLRYLVEVADGPSLSAAARRLGISQPVLSRAVRTLERELRADLFALDGRRLHVRADAEPVVTAAREALAAVEKVGVVAARLHAQEVTIAATPSHQMMLTSQLPALSAAAGSTVRLLTASGTEDMAGLLRAGRADVGFGEAPQGPIPDLEVRILGVMELVLAGASGTLDDLPDPVDLGTAGPIAIATLDNPERVGLLEKIVVNAGGAVDVVFESADRMVLMKAVEAGVAPTIGPRVLVEGNPLLDLRTFTPSIGYPVAALVDPSRTRPAIDAVLATLRAGA